MAKLKIHVIMATLTLQIPNAQVGWFEQMIRTMGWSFRRENTPEEKEAVTPALRRRINTARKEKAQGLTVSCSTPEEMQRYFDSL